MIDTSPAEATRPSLPAPRVPWMLRWLVSRYLAVSVAYAERMEAYADQLEARISQLTARVATLRDQTTPDIDSEQRDGAWLEGVLSTLPGYGAGITRVALDNKYWVCSETDFGKVVDHDPTDEKRYAADQFDCDNFSFTFKARVGRQFGINSVGVVIDHSSAHAYSLVVFLDGTAKIFEPQNDQWPSIGDRNYKLQSGLIII